MWERTVGQLLFVLNCMYGFQLHGHTGEVPASPERPAAVLLLHTWGPGPYTVAYCPRIFRASPQFF